MGGGGIGGSGGGLVKPRYRRGRGRGILREGGTHLHHLRGSGPRRRSDAISSGEAHAAPALS